MKIYIIILVITLLNFGCNNPDNPNQKDSFITNSKKDSIIKLKDSLVEMKPKDQKGSHKIFISITPSTQWIDSMQKVIGEDNWNEVVSDNSYYEDLTKSFLISKGYKEIDEPVEKIWTLTGANGIIKKVNSDTLKDKWGLIIFDGQNDPVFYNGTQPESELLVTRPTMAGHN